MKIFAKNRRAKFDYEFITKYEAGISLVGSEVKSIKNNQIDLTGSYVIVDKNKNIQWINGKIEKYKYNTSEESIDERRTRQLLLNKKEIRKIINEVVLKRLIIIPYKVYALKSGIIKLEFFIAKPKKLRDKRETEKKRDLSREVKDYY